MQTGSDPVAERFGLSRAVIDAINDVFAAVPTIEQVILYGSRAKGTQRKGSDIDLSIVAPDMNERQLLALETRLEDLSLPYTIDLSLLHEIVNPMLVEHIKRVGLVFYPEAALGRSFQQE